LAVQVDLLEEITERCKNTLENKNRNLESGDDWLEYDNFSKLSGPNYSKFGHCRTYANYRLFRGSSRV